MKIVIAPDSYKDCLSAIEVARHIEIGIRRVLPTATILRCPMADGGEGTVTSVAAALNLPLQTVRVTDPLGRPVDARFSIIGETALIEMAEASGLERLQLHERNPMVTHTLGTGELIRCALDMGIRDFVISVGGSATVDGGTGMASALGYVFLDAHGKALLPSGKSLVRIAAIDATMVDVRVGRSTFRVATDVISPLLGTRGAAMQYGPQKGATPHMVEQLEIGLAGLQALLVKQGLLNPAALPGDGAGGGLGMGIRAFLNGTLISGAKAVADMVRLEQHLNGANYVVTGEGRTDLQSSAGKLCDYVERLSRQHNVPTILLSGQIADHTEEFTRRFRLAGAVTPPGTDVKTAIANSRSYLQEAAAAAFKSIC
ncbi:MAG: glycerate kinase [Deltaproteobacteria bacterium]|nr:glycerate kinase [Deltaproteobacteria bacterium]